MRRTVLSLAAAAIVAVSLPFSALYVHALNQHAALTANRIVHVGAGPGHATTVTTRASGGVATTTPAQATGQGSLSAPTTVTTRAS
ncbi:MAG TPA: hypothetical protein VFB39_14420 [Solirubrobacteraceae bacterium]|nr:hypothetical protein [Solirubrobacteraceae bacterium]